MPRQFFAAILILVVGAMGCSNDSGPPKKSTFKASGKLMVDGKPFGPATLTLSSTSKGADSPSMTGNVAKDGTITFVTYGDEGSVAAGTYDVTMAGDVMAMTQVPAVEPAKIEIKPGDKSVEIALKSIPGAAPVGALPLPGSPPMNQ